MGEEIIGFKQLVEDISYEIEIFDNFIGAVADNVVGQFFIMEMHYRDRYSHLAGSTKTKRLRKKMVSRIFSYWERKNG